MFITLYWHSLKISKHIYMTAVSFADDWVTQIISVEGQFVTPAICLTLVPEDRRIPQSHKANCCRKVSPVSAPDTHLGVISIRTSDVSNDDEHGWQHIKWKMICFIYSMPSEKRLFLIRWFLGMMSSEVQIDCHCKYHKAHWRTFLSYFLNKNKMDYTFQIKPAIKPSPVITVTVVLHVS